MDGLIYRAPDLCWLSGPHSAHVAKQPARRGSVRLREQCYFHPTSDFPTLSAEKEMLKATCVHGDTQVIPTTHVLLGGARKTWLLTVCLVPELPVPVLVGQD